MVFRLEIETENAAFTDNVEGEIVAILRALIHKLETKGMDDYPLMDSNGNKVGRTFYD